jgi:hypothetical protein
VAGTLSRGKRGLILSTKDELVWIIDSDDPADKFVGSDIVVEGVVIGFDRLRADWIGTGSQAR